MATEAKDKASDKPSLCFVIGPIGKDGSSERKHSDLMLHAVIKHVLQKDEFSYVVKRADEDADPGMIGDRVVTDIINAALVVADLTDLNPNAFYELGIRHSTEKPTIHVARMGTVLPFDTIAHRTIFVDLGDWHSIEQARERLANSARAVMSPNYKVSNPITQASASFQMRQSDDPRDRVVAEMQERMLALEGAISKTSAEPAYVSQDRPYNKIRDALQRGLKIEAIKEFRAATGLGLKDSKDIVEAFMNIGPIEAAKVLKSATRMSTSDAKQAIERLFD